MTNIIIDPEFQNKIPHLSEEEFSGLRDDILADGYVRDPLTVWEETGILLDGHNRWKVITENWDLLKDSFRVDYRSMPDRWAAIAWICANQLHRHNMNDLQRAKLIQEEYDARKRTIGAADGFRGNQYKKVVSEENLHLPNEKAPKLRTEIAKEHNINEGTVQSSVEWGRGLDAAEEVAPGIRDAVLSGEEKHAKRDIAALRNIKDPEERKEAVENLRNPNRVTFPTGKNNWKNKPTAADEEIAKRDERVTNRHAKVEYTAEDLVEELTIIQNDFFQKYLLALDVHRDVALDTAKGRREVLGCIKEFEKKFNTDVKEIFK